MNPIFSFIWYLIYSFNNFSPESPVCPGLYSSLKDRNMLKKLYSASQAGEGERTIRPRFLIIKYAILRRLNLGRKT